MADEMYDESEPTTSEAESVANDTNDTPGEQADNKKADGESTEDQLSLVPKHFFKQEPKPGNRETVEVVEVYEGEVSIKCVYGDKDDEAAEESDDEGEGESEPAAEEEDSMMV